MGHQDVQWCKTSPYRQQYSDAQKWKKKHLNDGQQNNNKYNREALCSIKQSNKPKRKQKWNVKDFIIAKEVQDYVRKKA